MLIYKTIRKKKKKRSKKGMAQIKGKFNYKHKRRKMGTKYVKGKKDFEVINLDLKTPPGFPSLIGQGRPSCHSPETIRKSLFMPLLDSGRHEMSLTSGFLVFR